MPTPASVARQCLTKEAEQALDEAVAVARRRGHAQTTSLHMVSSLLSFPSSALREACSRTRNNAYSMRVQFKALELCLGVSLDRLPSSPKRVEEPPVSNSLMAAIKRSQANQRRQPENFSFYQQQQQLLSSSSSSSISVVKVELQNLILSILDDPMVSRVFGEAGFRSCDIKIAIIRPVNHLLRYSTSRYKGPPIFLCNLSADNELGRRGFSFPFMGFSGVSDSDENCRRIAEVMVRSSLEGNSGRNPLLVGACASDSLRSFLEMVKWRRGTSVLPVELFGLGVICIENEILRFVSGHCEEGMLKLRLEEVHRMVKDSTGVVVNFGDLKALTNENVLADALRILVSDLASLLVEVHEQKVWLIGAAARYETYLKFLSMFPTIEKDWNLQLLPITTLRSRMAEAYPRSSLMESFVPFGGFFSTPDMNNKALRSSFNNMSRCHACNEKCNQEVNAIVNGGLTSPSVADSYGSNLPSWLQMSELRSNGGLDVKAKDDTVLLSAEIAGLQRKWDDICQRLNHNQEESKANSYQLDSRVPSVVGFQDRKENTSVDSSNHTDASLTGALHKNVDSRDEENFTTSKASNVNFLLKFDATSSKEREKYRLESPFNASSSSVGDGLTSPSSVTSITLDLNLEFNTGCQSSELEKCIDRNRVDFIQDFSFCSSTNPEVARGSDSSNQVKSSSCSQPDDIDEQFDQKDFKTLYATLVERIGWQEAAVKKISQTLARFRTINERQSRGNRGDKWFYILGPDRLGKMKLAAALAEILQGSRESLIHVDLGFQEEMNYSNVILDHQVWNSHDVRYRGKNVVDYIAEKLNKKPLSVLFLESIEKADLLVQNSLLQALKTGRFPDSHGREISISNAIFVATSKSADGEQILYSEPADYCEEDILAAKPWPIRMMIGFDLCDDFMSASSDISDTERKGNACEIILNKRKLIPNRETTELCSNLEMAKRAHRTSDVELDLNFPAEESEICDTTSPGNSESDSICDNSRTWLEHFSRQVDATVVFQPFDFDAVAHKLVQAISTCFEKVVPSECSVEIDSRVMMQMIAAACSTNTKKVENWVHSILGRGFEEAQQKYCLTARSTMKLVACEGTILKGETPIEFLPSRIILN